MIADLLRTGMQNSAKRVHIGLVFALATCLYQGAMATTIVNLETASGFAILAGSQITDAGGASTIVTGDVGLYPATGAAIGLTEAQVIAGTIYRAETSGALLNGAKNDLTNAYDDAAGRPADLAFGVVDNQLGGKILFPGVYSFGHAATANLIGTLTLDANGDPNPVWIFQASSDLVTAGGAPGSPGSSVELINGATPCDVFWQVGSSATIGTYSDFVGNIMADQSIALQTGATLEGSALARIAAVTLDNNTIAAIDCSFVGGDGDGTPGDGTGGPGGGGVGVPDSGGTLLLLGSGLATVFAFRRRLN